MMMFVGSTKPRSRRPTLWSLACSVKNPIRFERLPRNGDPGAARSSAISALSGEFSPLARPIPPREVPRLDNRSKYCENTLAFQRGRVEGSEHRIQNNKD